MLDERGLVPDEDADDALAAITGMVVSEIHTIPARTTRDMAQRVVIEAAMHQMQSEVAAWFSEQAEAPGAKPTKTSKREGGRP